MWTNKIDKRDENLNGPYSNKDKTYITKTKGKSEGTFQWPWNENDNQRSYSDW